MPQARQQDSVSSSTKGKIMASVVQSSSLPTQKLIVSGLAGSITTVGIWAAKQFGNLDIPPEIAAQMAVIVGFVAAYVVPPSDRDQIKAAP